MSTSAGAARAAADPGSAGVQAAIAAYYTRKVNAFGATPLGVDWTCAPTQELRFVQLLRICDFAKSFSLNDLGCGYGALLTYLDRRHSSTAIDYAGVDLSAAMVRRGRSLWRGRPRARFYAGCVVPRRADYGVASGIFNVQCAAPRKEWENFIGETLRELHRTSTLGFAVNFVRARDGEATREGLYATRPEPWIDYCTSLLGMAVELIEGYGLREFTLLARAEC